MFEKWFFESTYCLSCGGAKIERYMCHFCWIWWHGVYNDTEPYKLSDAFTKDVIKECLPFK